MASVTPIKVGSRGLTFHGTKELKESTNSKLSVVIYLLRGTYFLFSVRKILMKTLLGEGNTALASLKSAPKLRGSQARHIPGSEAEDLKWPGRDYSLFPF